MLLREVNPASGSPSALGPRAARRDISAASRLAVLTLAALLALTSPQLTAEAVAQQAEQAAAEQTQQSASVDLKVEIIGLDEELLANVEALTGIVRTSRSRDVRPGHVYRMHDKAPGQIATALEPFGFYSPTIQSSLTTEGSPWLARYAVDPGPPTLVTRLDVRVEGAAGQDSVFVQTLASLPLAEGDTLNHQAYETAKTTLGLLAADR
ncbi:MAG: hypothetical protein JJE01_14065, partial [Gemmatimonadetes bacterium]|nr:hypothetical protein [Gemmatimonadota bacterium]